jgi:NADPH:quinone reductase-like Zn-dependent oxidoreductase
MKRLTLAATTLRARTSAEKGAIRDALLDRIWPLVAEGRVRPVVDRQFPLAEAKKAHEYMEKPGATGKILLIP